MKNKKGFTLVEIIVAITIMGIILVITMPKIINLANSNKNTKYYAYEQALERAAKAYIEAKDKGLTELQEPNDCYKIDYEVLKQQNLIKEFQEKDVTCYNSTETFVMVQKATNNEYQYNTSLVCYKKGEHVYGTVKSNGKCEKVVEPEPLKPEPTQTPTKEPEPVPADGQCTIKVLGKKGNNNWYTGNVTLSLKVSGKVEKKGLSVNKDDANGKTTLTQKASTKSRKFYGYIKYENGKEDRCSKTIKVDMTKPSTPTVNAKKWTKAQFDKYQKKNNTPTSKSGMSSYSGGWYKYPIFTYPSGSSDGHSGLDHYEVKVTGDSTHTSNYKCTYRNIIASGTSNISYRACDKAGNCSGYSSAKTIKVDTKDPSCSVTKSNTKTTSGVTAKFKCSDKHSGVDFCPGGKDHKVTKIKKTTEYTVKDKVGRTDKCKVKVTSYKEENGCYLYKKCSNAACGTEKCNCKKCYTCKCRNEQTNKFIKVKGKVYSKGCWTDKGGTLRFVGDGKFQCATTHNTNHIEVTGKKYECQCSKCNKSCRTKACGCEKANYVIKYK